jgi:hypothetical protein
MASVEIGDDKIKQAADKERNGVQMILYDPKGKKVRTFTSDGREETKLTFQTSDSKPHLN